ncbi:ABC transporter ATP-binding protein [Nocardioides carbamazepini]|uniref:ABC transporter ATP-binding protein n=1 Tax=Nocardioides carbamazepini TaxID=2854259 RepID=UPI00214A2B83|nr:ABC transporter ATP-binding protein [Nocardioides carbamazepini]MCR1782753.1 ABC transporter ATP-binding protein [Nocardioides carbamazepini]
MATSIVVENATKYFTLRYHRTFKEVAVAKAKGRPTSETFKAVDDVSFTVEQGESIGIMGLNGSGKSTLLKMINGVMKPDEGSILTRGRIAGLIATGAGFHNQLTGRENLYLNAAILGMTEAEIKRKLDDIVEFAELGHTLDGPVGHYSSGQKARLGFAIAIHVDSDIFLADEVLAVGDKPFRVKCMKKMRQIRKSGRTLFYVSHSPDSVIKMCNRVLVLEKGRLGFDGDPTEAVHYLRYDEGDDLDDEIANDI